VRAVIDGRIAGVGLDVYGQETARAGRSSAFSALRERNVIPVPHLTFYTSEAMQRLEEETLMRCVEILEAGRCLCVQTIRACAPRQRACDLIDERTDSDALTMT